MQAPISQAAVVEGFMQAITGAAPVRERRRDSRGPVLRPAKLKVVDGGYAGTEYEVQTRGQSAEGASFLLKVPLSVGQWVTMTNEIGKVRTAEVVRSRPLSNGKYEMMVQFRLRGN